MASNAPLVALGALTLGVVTYVAVALPPDGGGPDVAALEERLRAAEARADAVDELRRDVRALAERIDRRAEEREERAAAAPSLGTAAGAGPGADASADGPPSEDVLDAMAERVGKKVAERIDRYARRAGQMTPDGRWKPPLEDFATELSLTEAQTAEAKRQIDAAKDRGYALLKTQRLDGGSLLDDYVAALKSGADPGASTQELFKRILSERVPGSDTSYLASFLEISGDVERQVGEPLDAARRSKIRSLRMDWLGIETGYDPTGDYVRARLQ